MTSSALFCSLTLGLFLGLAPAAPPKAPPKPPPTPKNPAAKNAKAAAKASHTAQQRRIAYVAWLRWHVHFHVGVAAPGPHFRTFKSRNEALAYMSRLRRYGFVHHMKTQSNGSVIVNFSSVHWHRVLSTHFYATAVSTAARMQSLGFVTRITRHVY